ncbi:MAG: class II fructose-bisphosphate aldolase, partial [Eubacteriales bacterium]
MGSFNTPNMACARAVIAAAEELEEPVILMRAQIHEEMGLCRMDEIGPV